MHVYKIVHGGVCNQNGIFNFTKLFMHSYKLYQIVKRDLDGNENLRERKIIYLLGSKD